MTDSKRPCYCQKEKDIAKLQSEFETVKKVVMGNSHPGLIDSVPRLDENVSDLNMNVTALKRGVNGFLKFQSEMEGRQLEREQQRKKYEEKLEQLRKRNRWIVTTIITILTSALALIAGIHFG